MPTIGLIQHTFDSNPGSALPWLHSRGFRVLHRRLYLNEAIPRADEVDGLLICGGEMNVDQEHVYPWLKTEKRLIETLLKQNKKVVGLCLGGQLIAEVLGARVGRHRDWEVGWHDMQLLQKSSLPGFQTPQTLKVFQWHGYVFDLPPGAQRLARNDWWGTQAYVWNNTALGFQFHPETDLERSNLYAMDPDLPTTGLVQKPAEILRDGPIYQPILQRWFEQVLEGFLIQ